MSADIYHASDSRGNNANLQGNVVGGAKPLHRFIKGQPKLTGIIALVLGSSVFLLAIAIMPQYHGLLGWNDPAVFFLATMFVSSGILYILTEHNPTKKTVTISLALSIVTILAVGLVVFRSLPFLFTHHQHRSYGISEENDTFTYEDMEHMVEAIFLAHSVLGAVIFIVMSCLAGASLRSTKSQAIVVMTTAANEAPVE